MISGLYYPATPLSAAPLSSFLVYDDGGAWYEALAVVVAAEEVAVVHLHHHRQDVAAVEAEVAVVRGEAMVEGLYQSARVRGTGRGEERGIRAV